MASNIHLKNIYEEGELSEAATIKDYLIVARKAPAGFSAAFAEDQAKRHRQIFMRDWRERLDAFLRFNERDILTNAGKVAKEVGCHLDERPVYGLYLVISEKGC